MKAYSLREVQTGRSVKLITEAKTCLKVNGQLLVIMYIVRGMPGGEPVAPMISPALCHVLLNDLAER